MIKVLFIFGTRPEAIKLCPVIRSLREYPVPFDVKVCVTAQHREMLDQVLEAFGVAPDQATKEKIALCCGNVAGVAKVNNMMSVDQSAPEATYYTVVSGDSLSAIAQRYGTTAEALQGINNLPDTMLHVGQKLVLP